MLRGLGLAGQLAVPSGWGWMWHKGNWRESPVPGSSQPVTHPKALQRGQAPLAGPGSLLRVPPREMGSWHGQGPALLELSLAGRAPHLLPWGL